VIAGGSAVLAASNGDIVIGTTATDGAVDIGGLAAAGRAMVVNDLPPDNTGQTLDG
jgi:hypothetical protein